MTNKALGPKLAIFQTSLSRCNSKKRFEHKENQTKYRKINRKPRSHVGILIYQTLVIITHFKI